MSYIDGSEQGPKLCLTKRVHDRVHEMTGARSEKLIQEYKKKKFKDQSSQSHVMAVEIVLIKQRAHSLLSSTMLMNMGISQGNSHNEDVTHKWNVQLKISMLQQRYKSIKDDYGEFSQLWYELSIFEPKRRILMIS